MWTTTSRARTARLLVVEQLSGPGNATDADTLSVSGWKGHPMGMRRRARRRGLIAGAATGAAIAHHGNKTAAEEEQAAAAPAEEQAAPVPTDTASELEHLAQLHASGALSDEEFAAAKAKALGT